ncbi:uncharacterized protein LOC130777630 [Actinidia eriantha]|uniref:uncharacterized protein LOC130777630 n=1 Tax=Actinidia eriantha TaxID=165200 RepID=UPI00258EF3B0|nr:uncharacterized protein LOC130777630 [Actinidia eriantha]
MIIAIGQIRSSFCSSAFPPSPKPPSLASSIFLSPWPPPPVYCTTAVSSPSPPVSSSSMALPPSTISPCNARPLEDSMVRAKHEAKRHSSSPTIDSRGAWRASGFEAVAFKYELQYTWIRQGRLGSMRCEFRVGCEISYYHYYFECSTQLSPVVFSQLGFSKEIGFSLSISLIAL